MNSLNQQDCNVKLPIRGRGKFTPNSNISLDEVREILQQKIKEESDKIGDEDSSYLELLNYDKSKVNIASLFSGCGGLDLGFELAGIEKKIGPTESNEAFHSKDSFIKHQENGLFNTFYTNDIFTEANQSYKENINPNVFQHQTDIRKIKEFPKADIILGGFPCPGFSQAGPRLIDDPRNFLYIHFVRAVMQSKPYIFVAENVKGLLSLGKGEVLKQILQDFRAAGYKVKYKLLNSRDFGVPQLRERVFIIGVRDDLDFDYTFPEPTHGPNGLPYISLRDAIKDLEEDPGPYHIGSYSSMYMSRNRKKTWDQQSFTIQASGRQAPLHPSGLPMKKIGPDKWIFPDGENNHRRLSIKEVARIQTFPDWFKFSVGTNKNISENGLVDKQYKQIGNAVPVLLAKAVALPIANFFTN